MLADYIELKEIFEGIINFLENNPRDTSPERIAENRKKLGTYYRTVNRILNLRANKPVQVQTFIDDLLAMFADYYQYFDTGYKSKFNIDELPQLLKAKLGQAIGEINKQ